MKTIICPNYLKGYYLTKLLNENNIIFDTKLMPFEAFAYKFEQTPKIQLLIQAKNIMNKLDLKVFAPMLKYPKFIEEIVDFAQILILYNQDINLLPEDNPQEIELKKIIKAIYNLPFPEYNKRQTTINNENVECLDFFCNDLFTASLKENISTIIPFSNLKNVNNHGRFALNARQEIESVAQDIVCKQNAHISTIILCDYQNQLPLLKQIFNRYNIPFTTIKDLDNPKVVTRFTKTIDFMLNHSINNLKECLFNHCFKYNYPSDLYAYFDTFINDISDLYNIPDLENINILNTNDLNIIKDMSIRSKEYFQRIKEEIDICLNSDIKDVLFNAYEIVKDTNDITSTNKIANIINDSLNDIKDIQDILIVKAQIEGITIDNSNYQEDSVIVTDLSHPVFSNKYGYILGCTSKTYPNFTNYDGIFDESYISKLDIIPLNHRYDLYMQQLSWIKTCAKEIYYSYYTNDYANKVFELALEIEELNLTFTRWPLISNDIYLNNNPTLKDSSIFFKNDMLYGSVSSFERYFNCPYAYFLQYGLKINQQYNFKIEANIIGTIMHAIMENLIKVFGKKYVSQKDNLLEISNDYFKQLNKLFPKEKLFIKALQNRMIENIQINLEMLEKMEKDTSFEPYETEYKFKQQFEDLNILIRGTIDRIDSNLNYFRIIDYKSSTKKLQEKKIQSGLQLQLMTYLILGENFMNKQAVGAYYYSLKNENIKVPAAKIAYGEITENNETEKQRLYEESKKLEGLTLDNAEKSGLDYGDNIRNSKLDFNLVKECIYYVYNYLLEQLSSGNISITPSTDACTYCQYHNICLNKKQGEDHVIYDKPLKPSKGE